MTSVTSYYFAFKASESNVFADLNLVLLRSNNYSSIKR